MANAMFAGSAGAAAFFQRVVEIETCGLQRGHAAEQNAGEHRGGHREEQDGDVECDVGFGRKRVLRHQRHDYF